MSKNHVHLIPLMAAMSIGLAACATDETQPDAGIDDRVLARDDIVCRRERTIGSHVPVRVCRTRGEIEDERQRAQDAVGPLRTMGMGDDQIRSQGR